MPLVECNDPVAVLRSCFHAGYKAGLVYINHPFKPLEPDDTEDGPYEEQWKSLSRLSRLLLTNEGVVIVRCGPSTLHLVLDVFRGAYLPPEHYVQTYPEQPSTAAWLISNHEHILVFRPVTSSIGYTEGLRYSVTSNWMAIIGGLANNDTIVVEPTGVELAWADGQVKFYLGTQHV